MHPDSLLKRIFSASRQGAFSKKTRQNVSAPQGDDTVRKDVVLITNNPCFKQIIDPLRLQFLSGTSLDVLVVARDAVHLGNELLTHPLYGNLRPNQQPFRSILLRLCAQKERNSLESISTIEEAVRLYRSYGNRLPATRNLSGSLLKSSLLPDAIREDHSLVDFELMRESLSLYGLLPKRISGQGFSYEGGETVCPLI